MSAAAGTCLADSGARGRAAGRHALGKVIIAINDGVPTVLAELHKLGSTLRRRAGDVLAYFDHPRTSKGPTEAINGRLEHLRRQRPRLPQPHHLHRQIAARYRRLQIHSYVMS